MQINLLPTTNNSRAGKCLGHQLVKLQIASLPCDVLPCIIHLQHTHTHLILINITRAHLKNDALDFIRPTWFSLNKNLLIFFIKISFKTVTNKLNLMGRKIYIQFITTVNLSTNKWGVVN